MDNKIVTKLCKGDNVKINSRSYSCSARDVNTKTHFEFSFNAPIFVESIYTERRTQLRKNGVQIIIDTEKVMLRTKDLQGRTRLFSYKTKFLKKD